MYVDPVRQAYNNSSDEETDYNSNHQLGLVIIIRLVCKTKEKHERPGRHICGQEEDLKNNRDRVLSNDLKDEVLCGVCAENERLKVREGMYVNSASVSSFLAEYSKIEMVDERPVAGSTSTEALMEIPRQKTNNSV
ncbi:hypothetical protein FQN60_004885 [Etheostoma spectabile]|uniref:Uncharacterized protein n=1 Tax=Etheostoma spectabile TaxID=54343 RepID=A0A5J5DL42_9PERO|nr:hypothetical protein FQN60_004885 [Etheostoma spectabile]